MRSFETGRRQRKTAVDYIEYINRCRVSFELKDEDEQKIRRLGKYLGKKGLDDLIAAIKSNYRLDVAQQPKLDQPTFTEKFDLVDFTIGSNTLSVSPKTGIVDLSRLFKFSPTLPLKLYIEDNKPYVDAEIFVHQFLPPVKLRHNELMNLPPHWDRNSNKVAFEIVNEHQVPMYQLYYKTPTHIIINGIFVSGNGVVVATDSGTILNPSLPVTINIKPIFKYPSWKYRGEYADERVEDRLPEQQVRRLTDTLQQNPALNPQPQESVQPKLSKKEIVAQLTDSIQQGRVILSIGVRKPLSMFDFPQADVHWTEQTKIWLRRNLGEYYALRFIDLVGTKPYPDPIDMRITHPAHKELIDRFYTKILRLQEILKELEEKEN